MNKRARFSDRIDPILLWGRPFGLGEFMTIRFTVSAVIPATPKQIYEAWLDSRAHGAMTGGAARCTTKKNGKFTAWDGYIAGRNLALQPGKRILQSWRTTKFKKTDPDSQVELTMERSPRGTRVTLQHTEVPDGHDHYKEGWKTHYFEPMKAFFAAKATARKNGK